MKEVPADFVEVHDPEIAWQANPQIPEVGVAVLVGHPGKPGPLVVRVNVPPDFEVAPHVHPDARTYTVLSGSWKLGFGASPDQTKLTTFNAGDLYRLPAGVPHYQVAGPEGAVFQIESIGPTSTDFLEEPSTELQAR